ncbi:MAG: MFS transporter [Thermomicrobiales bacterium]
MNVERSVLTVVLLATAMSNLDQSIVGVALPTFRRVFEAEIGLIQWVVLAYQIAIVAVLLLAGWLSDRVGSRRIFLAGLVLFTLASGLCGVALNIWQLVIFRSLQGIGAAMLLATGQVLLTNAYPAERRGTAMGLMHMAVAVGLTAGPSLGGFLIEFASWRAIFLLNLPVGCVALWLAWTRLPRVAVQPATGQRFGLWIFRSWPLIAGLLAAFLTFVALASNMFLIPFALQPLMGLSPSRAGLVMIAVPLTILVIAPLSGRLTDRIGPRWPATAGLALVALSILLMAQLHSGSMVAFAVMILVLYGIGAGRFQAPNNAAVMTAAPTQARGMVSGTLALSRSLGQIGGVALASTVWDRRQEVYARRPGGEDPLGRALQDSFLLLAMVAIVAVAVSMLRGDIHGQ